MPSADELHKSLVDQSRTAGQSPSPAPGGNNGGATGTVEDYIRFWGGTPPNNTSGNGSTGSSTDAASAGRRLLRNLLGEWPHSYAAPAHLKGTLEDDRDGSLPTAAPAGTVNSLKRMLIAILTPTTSKFCPSDRPLCYFDEDSSTTDAANNTASGNGTSTDHHEPSADHHESSPGRRLLHKWLGV